ncbi:MAG TPA: GAF domain-containing protein [Acidimicrobiales bacterium]|nr:GAF domain-containing protein [Acidimicrobiales bacterium]
MGGGLVGPGEARRLVALYRLDIFDTPASACFERLAGLAARLFEVPLATIGLVDAVREWSLARYGDVPAETPREASLADLVIRAGAQLVVEDASKTAPMLEHEVTRGGGRSARFMAGHPLRCASGELVGALCILGLEPRAFSPRDRQMLGELAGVVEDELALRVNRCFDERTGLLLRRGLDILAGHVVSRACRHGEPVSIVVLDVDLLDVVHPSQVGASRLPSGPAAQRHPRSDAQAGVELVAGVIRGATRASDVAARLPCDELVVLLPDTDGAECATVAQRLQDEIELAAHRAAGPRPVVHLSTATLDPSGDEMSLAALLREAVPFDGAPVLPRRGRPVPLRPGSPRLLRTAAPPR